MWHPKWPVKFRDFRENGPKAEIILRVQYKISQGYSYSSNVNVFIFYSFSGVYFEKTLKGTSTTLWARNFQLAVFSIIIGTIGMYINDGEKIRQKGILFGYHSLVWLIIVMQAFGGILIGVVVKYADNILKGFSAAVSIVVSCIASVFLFQFQLSAPFVMGAGLVMFSTYLYGVGHSSSPKENVMNGAKLDKKSE